MGTETKKPVTVARTQLKVSRSLDPSTMQTVNVLTKDGSVAQLIVKRRDGKSQQSTTPPNTPDDPRKSTIQTNWVPLSTMKVEDEFFNAQQSQIGNQINHQNSEIKVPKPVTIRSGNVFVKVQDEVNKRGRSIIQLGNDGIPVIHGVRVPDDESDKVKVWRNARVVNGELMPYDKENRTPKPTTEGQLIYATESNEEDNRKSIGPFTTADNYAYNTKTGPGIGPFTVDDIRQPNRGNFVRFSTDNGFGPFTRDDNARFANSKLIDYIKKINEQESKRDYFSGRRYNEGEQTDNHQIQRRMLQYNNGNHNYPNSLLYTPTTTKLSRVNFNDGVRTPVLTYAHPELGVQPAKVPSEEELNMQKERDRANMYTYTQDINGRNPYVVDANDYMHSGRNSDRQNGYYTEQNEQYYRRPEMTYSPYGGNYYRVKPPMPFWMRISETLKDNLQHGITKMQQMARPVIGPIMEATQKIGHNLGFMPHPPYRMVDEAQDKIEVAAPAAALGGSVILPALGLVAGGAALGLGAAAVGRFLDVGNMRSAHDTLVDEAEMQHKRALERYGNSGDYVVIMETNGHENKLAQDNSVRRRRSVAYEDKFLDDIIQSVEHEAGATTLGSHLVGSGKWADTPCSKRMFCDIMVQQPYEQVAFMEKKIDTYLSM